MFTGRVTVSVESRPSGKSSRRFPVRALRQRSRSSNSCSPQLSILLPSPPFLLISQARAGLSSSTKLTITMLQRQAGLLRRFPNVALRARLCAPACQRTLATPATPPSPNDAFANGTNAYYAEEMYRHWKQDPKSVHASWDAYFSGMDKGLPSASAFQPPPNLVPYPAGGAPALHAGGGAELDDHLKVRFGHARFCVAP